MFDVVVRGGRVVLPTGLMQADVGVSDGQFAAIASAGELKAKQVIDADGMVVIPGAIDPHVHIHTNYGAWTTVDDFHTGTAPAAFGGTTTIIEFALPEPGETTAAAIRRRIGEAAGAAVVDYGFHACVAGQTIAKSLLELPSLGGLGVGSVKIFTTYRETVGLTMEQIARVLKACATADLLVLVHAETDEEIQRGIAEQVEAGNLTPTGHLRARSESAEANAIEKVAALAVAAGARLYFVHVSSAEGAAAIAALKLRRQQVEGETCVQYLFLDESVYARPDGELWICSPPIRSIRHQAALWKALDAGTLDVVSTDHNAFSSKQKAEQRSDFRKVPNGLPGVELRMPLLLDAVRGGRLSWEGLARLTAEAPARIFGLWPRKGSIRVGADADFVLVEPDATTDVATSHMATDYTPFRGLNARGRIAQTWVRGTCVVADNGLLVRPGTGVYLGQPSPVSAASRAVRHAN